jgi:uncharacterized protein (TIGR03000 family)
MFRIVLFVLGGLAVSSTVFGQSRGGFHPGPNPGYLPSRGISQQQPLIPATVLRPSAAPLTAVPVKTFPTNRYGMRGGFGFYGGGYYPYELYQDPNAALPIIIEGPGDLEPAPWARSLVPVPPLPNEHPTTARLSLQVPSGASVWIQGKKVEMPGPLRVYESPELKMGETFAFDVRVTWIENGKTIEEKRTLTMNPGDFQSLQYIATPRLTTRVER